MSMRLSVVMMGACLAMSALTAHAAMYKWKDANGRVHYGDQPASGAVEVNAGALNGSAAPDPSDVPAENTQQKKAEECSRKRDQLANYKKASKIVETDSLGNQKEFNEDERKKLLERTQKQLTDSCGDSPEEAGAN